MELDDAKIDALCRAMHEVNRTWCEVQEDSSQPLWEDAPDWQRDAIRKGVLHHLEHPQAPDGAAHNAWLAEKRAQGWSYGEAKDAEAKTHPAMVPFDELSPERKAKYRIARAVVLSIVGAL